MSTTGMSGESLPNRLPLLRLCSRQPTDGHGGPRPIGEIAPRSAMAPPERHRRFARVRMEVAGQMALVGEAWRRLCGCRSRWQQPHLAKVDRLQPQVLVECQQQPVTPVGDGRGGHEMSPPPSAVVGGEELSAAPCSSLERLPRRSVPARTSPHLERSHCRRNRADPERNKSSARYRARYHAPALCQSLS
jgi:hypothetical protein